MRVGLGREHLEQVGLGGGHAQRVPVVGADLVDGAVLDGGHRLLGAADRADRRAAAQRLGERDQVRRDAEALGRAAGRDAQAGLDLVEDQDDPVATRDVADGLEVAGLREHDAEVHHRRLHDHAGGLAALLRQPLDATLHRARVIERDRDREVHDGLRDARSVGQAREVLVVADLVVLDADRDHHAVVVAVVGAEDLHDRLAAGGAAGDPDGVHRGLRAGVGEAPLRQAPATGELVTDGDRVLGRGGEVRAARVSVGNRLADRGMGVALDHRTEPVVEVPHLVAVDVPHPRASAALEVDRPWVAELVGRRHTPGQVDLGACVGLLRALRPLVELLLLTLDQLGDALTRDLNRCVGGHGLSRS